MRASLLYLFCVVVFSGCSSILSSPSSLGLSTTEFNYTPPERFVLENGLIVYFLEDRELPRIQGTLYVHGGGLNVSEELTGLSEATGSQMREGGIPGMTPQALDKRLDSLGASIETSFSEEFGSMAFFTLQEDFEEVFSLYANVIRRPQFNSERLALWKKLATEAISRRRDDPEAMGSMAFVEILFGKNSPYARTADYESLKRITRSQMKTFHQRYVRPNGSILAITGSIEKDELVKALEKNFGDWKKNDSEISPAPTVEKVPARGIYVLPREFEQATVYIGQLGPARLSPDFYDIALFNRIFGYSGFSSMLYQEVRSKRGLSYSVWGGFDPGTSTGTFQIYAGTRVSEVDQAIDAILEVVKMSQESLPDDKLFLDAKSATERSYVFKFSEADKLVTRAAYLELLDYPKDYDEKYIQRLEAVTKEAVQTVAKTRLQPESFVTVIVGNVDPEEIKAKFGDVYPVYELEFTTEPRVKRQL